VEIKDLVEEIIACKNKTITDEVFLLIQSNRDFMQKYLVLVDEKGHDVVNRHIGKMVMQKYNLTPGDGRNEEPQSTLILSHQEF
jgi:hypothetical protein